MMLKSVFIPHKTNAYAWLNVLFLIVFLVLGEIDPIAVLFGYFLETIIIGVFTIFKMYLASKHDGSGKSIKFLIPFFMFHYGMFVAVQSVFVFAVVGMSDAELIKEPFQLLQNYSAILNLKGMNLILILLVVSQTVKFIFDFLEPKKHLQFTASEIMVMPYVRIIIIQQFAVIIAMFFMLFSQADIVAAILLIIIRAFVDFFSIALKDNAPFLDYMAKKLDNGKASKAEIKKQLLLFSE
ncbi:DUF6498-containing protein [Lacinutrix jangbogonensis]|uniref:DUF6498-containing protein n=1 Tax=Lacinutrix jangbogonensis TaxID=1469557 RepID=UPI000A882C36|nr:DUF6498-containing protein [Lacinutrix jangbogonensis]